ncbi:MAG: hypothetical protein H8E30_07960 [Alphaproteobacteria bacterium]|nr:hypothetical protein [Alphaproteobacteria bacterium]
MQRLPVKDDNLRLILSKGHDQWLNNEIRDRWIAIAVLLALFTVSVSWVISEVRAENAPPEIVRVDANESAVDTEQDSGQQNDPGGMARAFTPIFGLTSVLVILASPLFMGYALFEIFKLRRWRAEHRTFLKSYNRPVD